MKTRMCQALLIIAVIASTDSASWAFEDKDGDGLNDAVEAMLLDRHRPILIYESDERHYPVSILDFVQHSLLEARYTFSFYSTQACTMADHQTAYTESELANNPTLILSGLGGFRPADPTYLYCITETSFVACPDPDAGHKWALDINYALQRGVYPGTNGQGHRGMYGHVMPWGSDQIRLQYWQLFPWNEAECVSDCGDHAGDWVWIDLYLDANAPYTLRQITYHHHGDGNCAPISLPFGGNILYPAPIPLPPDGVPVCYLEEQAHEWWPWPSGGGECEFFPGFCDNASHWGDGISYRVPSVANVGEWYAPMPGSSEANLFVLFNGTWGYWGSECGGTRFAAPDSPMVQDFPSPVSWRFLSHGSPTNTVGSGTARDPWRQALTALGSSPVGTILRIMPGSYSAIGTWSTPLTLTAPLGTVDLSQ